MSRAEYESHRAFDGQEELSRALKALWDVQNKKFLEKHNRLPKENETWLHLKYGAYEIVGKPRLNKKVDLQIRQDRRVLGVIKIDQWKSFSGPSSVWDMKITDRDGNKRLWRTLVAKDSQNPLHRNRHFVVSTDNVATNSMEPVKGSQNAERPTVRHHYSGFAHRF